MRATGLSLASFVLFGGASAGPNLVQNPNITPSASSASSSPSADPPLYTAAPESLPPPLPLGGNNAPSYYSPAWIPHGQNIGDQGSFHNISHISPLGTFNASKLPSFIPGGPQPQGYPWANRTAGRTNAYTDPPNTGVTRRYTFDIAPTTIAPDGVERPGYLINGQFPGPTIEANWGDYFEITVNNNLDEGTSIHWHGLLQKLSPWMDGVPGISQSPIAPGDTFTYRFCADLYGTSWYHSHFTAQFTNGVYGAMVIHGPHDNADYDEDLGPVLVQDWFHTDYHALIEQVMAPLAEKLFPPLSNNVLINGKMNYPCDHAAADQKCTPNAGVSKFKFQSGKKYRLRLINGGAEAIQKFSIDNHKMTIIANDFVPLVPYEADVVTMGVGQRTDIIVEATGKPTDAVWMRSTVGPSYREGGCALNDGISPTAVAAIYYEDADTSFVPTTNSTVPLAALTACHDDPLESTVPYYPIAPTLQPEVTEQIDITYGNNGTHNLFYMNNSTFRSDYNDPLLLEAKLGQKTFAPMANVHDFGEAKSIRLVVYNHALTGAHPMHMHGHNMYVLASGTGTWDGSIVRSENPERRDTILLPSAVSPHEPTYLVVQIDADNPGAWPFHCHIAWHVSAGLYISILERPEDIKNSMQIPSIMAQTCRDWSNWTGDHVVDEIDSGL